MGKQGSGPEGLPAAYQENNQTGRQKGRVLGWLHVGSVEQTQLTRPIRSIQAAPKPMRPPAIAGQRGRLVRSHHQTIRPGNNVRG